MNNKAEVGPIGAIILFMMFLINWFIWLGAWLSDVGQRTIDANSLTGVEAFAYSNLNMIVWVCMILGMLGWMYLSGDR